MTCKHTKIVCTIGPSVSSFEKIEQLIDAGMNVARLNFSHGTHKDHAEIIANLKKAREKKGVPLAIMLDTKGPELRLGQIANGAFFVKAQDRFWLVKEKIEGSEKEVSLLPSFVIDKLEKEMFVLFDDGYIITHVVQVEKDRVQVEVDHGGRVKSSSGVNIPGSNIELPPLTEKDRDDIKFGCEADVDFIAASFIRSSEHVLIIKQLLAELGKADIDLIAKIENREGVENFDSIVQVSDGIMIARGDLGVELPLIEVPRLQKMMIRKCFLAGKPCVTATQMLESMIQNPRPTRAEASDVANAIYDSTSAVMLSGETAIGQHPLQVVKVMRELIEETERDFQYYDFFEKCTQKSFHDVPSSVTQASIKTAYSSNARAIFAFTTSGMTARLLSRFRPKPLIVAMTPKEKVYHQLALSWGVVPLLSKKNHSIQEAMKEITHFALSEEIVQYGDLVVVTAGTPFGTAGTTNMMIVDSIGEVLVRAKQGDGERVHGRVYLVPCADLEEYKVRGKIIVIQKCDDRYLPLLKIAAGVILENAIEDLASEQFLKKIASLLSLSYVTRANGAFSTLRQELLITLDPQKAIVYNGIL